MTKLDATTARIQFADLTSRVAYGKERVLIERRGKGIAALVPVEDLELLEALEDKRDVDAAKKALKAKGGTAWAKFKAARDRARRRARCTSRRGHGVGEVQGGARPVARGSLCR